ncbi:Plasmodium exported protein, unknown function [Plasmodium malariae]|uniref:Fam-m protein n=1 Tax=Plasmodium malariae TaxID=5858 RepID=A0A1D3SM24_PLAMA|nr:Plasmodium exported protein, unknown function [Plasmodium malariae]SCO92856.1 Plasmodium exported protein, unknown function [Plasmodium malariae]
MEEMYRSFISIKILAFVILILICHYNSINNFSKTLCKKYKLDGDLFLTTNRQLSEDSMYIKLNDVIGCNFKYNKLLNEDNSKNNEENVSKIKKFRTTALNGREWNKVPKKIKSSHNSMDKYFEKKIFNLLETFDKSDMKINKMTHNIKRRRMIVSRAIPIFFALFMGLVFTSLSKALVLIYKCTELRNAEHVCAVGSEKCKNFGVSQYVLVAGSVVLIFVIFLFILGIGYTFKKIEKYEKMKENNCKICYF